MLRGCYEETAPVKFQLQQLTGICRQKELRVYNYVADQFLSVCYAIHLQYKSKQEVRQKLR